MYELLLYLAGNKSAGNITDLRAIMNYDEVVKVLEISEDCTYIKDSHRITVYHDNKCIAELSISSIFDLEYVVDAGNKNTSYKADFDYYWNYAIFQQSKNNYYLNNLASENKEIFMKELCELAKNTVVWYAFQRIDETINSIMQEAAKENKIDFIKSVLYHYEHNFITRDEALKKLVLA